MTWVDTLPDSPRVGYSQNGEEGVLEAIFAGIGPGDRYLVDLGAGDGKTLSNTLALLEDGWIGLRFDRNGTSDGLGVNAANITYESILPLLDSFGVPRNLDLLSLDLDGNDFYILRKILRAKFRPRVMVVEFNPTLPEEPPVAIVYHPEHTFDSTNYFGASLGAFRRVCAAHGYCLVRILAGYNAFFVRDELVPFGERPRIEWTPFQAWPVDPHSRPWHMLTEAECSA